MEASIVELFSSSFDSLAEIPEKKCPFHHFCGMTTADLLKIVFCFFFVFFTFRLSGKCCLLVKLDFMVFELPLIYIILQDKTCTFLLLFSLLLFLLIANYIISSTNWNLVSVWLNNWKKKIQVETQLFLLQLLPLCFWSTIFLICSSSLNCFFPPNRLTFRCVLPTLPAANPLSCLSAAVYWLIWHLLLTVSTPAFWGGGGKKVHAGWRTWHFCPIRIHPTVFHVPPANSRLIPPTPLCSWTAFFFHPPLWPRRLFPHQRSFHCSVSSLRYNLLAVNCKQLRVVSSGAGELTR